MRKHYTWRQVEFTLDQLAQYNGTGGMPAYVALYGIVYDVSTLNTWRGGNHFGLMAGRDLTADYADCHMGDPAIIERLPKVGVLV